MSKVYRLKFVQELPVSMQKAWDFFSSPANLQEITPSTMDFRITSEPSEKMYAGQVIEYRVKPLAALSLYWMTEITHVEEGKYFVDEQRYGPYSLWHHQHHFREIEGGVEMTDIVHYKIPGWVLGDIANSIFVKKKLQEIFNYRYAKVEELFGKMIQSATLAR